MRISEVRLRRIIRSILAEGYAVSSKLGDSEDIPHSTDTHVGSLDDVLLSYTYCCLILLSTPIRGILTYINRKNLLLVNLMMIRIYIDNIKTEEKVNNNENI